MKFFGKEFTEDELQQRVGDLSQIAGIKSYTLNEGKAKGVDALDVKTGNGFNFTVLPDRAMDLAWMDYRGLPVGYITKAGIVNPRHYHPYGFEWLRSFAGGVLTTCGLTHVGDPEHEGDWDLGLHGRIANTPAHEVAHHTKWQEQQLQFEIEGKMREAVLYEENLLLSRKISACSAETKLVIADKVKNQGYQETPFMILYHINMGFPLVSENSELLIPVVDTEVNDEVSEKGIKNYDSFTEPIPEFSPQLFYHDLGTDENGMTALGVFNKRLDYGFYMKFNKEQLPNLTEWKMLGQQDYVVGLEPGNCTPMGRKTARKQEALEFLQPGEEREITLELGVLTGKEDLEKFRKKINELAE